MVSGFRPIPFEKPTQRHIPPSQSPLGKTPHKATHYCPANGGWNFGKPFELCYLKVGFVCRDLNWR
jgi:hypothetical protein